MEAMEATVVDMEATEATVVDMEATAVDTTVESVTLMPNQLPLLMPMLMLVVAMVAMEATDTAAESAALMPSPDMAMVDTAADTEAMVVIVEAMVADTVDMVDTDTAVKNFICLTFWNFKTRASILAKKNKCQSTKNQTENFDLQTVTKFDEIYPSENKK